jgi:hypothetical protein
VYQWYWVNGHLVSTDGQAKLQGALARLFRGEKQAATIVISAERFDNKPMSAALTQFSDDIGSVDALAHRIADQK